MPESKPSPFVSALRKAAKVTAQGPGQSGSFSPSSNPQPGENTMAPEGNDQLHASQTERIVPEDAWAGNYASDSHLFQQLHDIAADASQPMAKRLQALKEMDEGMGIEGLCPTEDDLENYLAESESDGDASLQAFHSAQKDTSSSVTEKLVKQLAELDNFFWNTEVGKINGRKWEVLTEQEFDRTVTNYWVDYVKADPEAARVLFSQGQRLEQETEEGYNARKAQKDDQTREGQSDTRFLHISDSGRGSGEIAIEEEGKPTRFCGYDDIDYDKNGRLKAAWWKMNGYNGKLTIDDTEADEIYSIDLGTGRNAQKDDRKSGDRPEEDQAVVDGSPTEKADHVMKFFVEADDEEGSTRSPLYWAMEIARTIRDYQGGDPKQAYENIITKAEASGLTKSQQNQIDNLLMRWQVPVNVDEAAAEKESPFGAVSDVAGEYSQYSQKQVAASVHFPAQRIAARLQATTDAKASAVEFLKDAQVYLANRKANRRKVQSQLLDRRISSLIKTFSREEIGRDMRNWDFPAELKVAALKRLIPKVEPVKLAGPRIALSNGIPAEKAKRKAAAESEIAKAADQTHLTKEQRLRLSSLKSKYPVDSTFWIVKAQGTKYKIGDKVVITDHETLARILENIDVTGVPGTVVGVTGDPNDPDIIVRFCFRTDVTGNQIRKAVKVKANQIKAQWTKPAPLADTNALAEILTERGYKIKSQDASGIILTSADGSHNVRVSGSTISFTSTSDPSIDFSFGANARDLRAFLDRLPSFKARKQAPIPSEGSPEAEGAPPEKEKSSLSVIRELMGQGMQDKDILNKLCELYPHRKRQNLRGVVWLARNKMKLGGEPGSEREATSNDYQPRISDVVESVVDGRAGRVIAVGPAVAMLEFEDGSSDYVKISKLKPLKRIQVEGYDEERQASIVKDVTNHVVRQKGDFWVDSEDMDTGEEITQPGSSITFTHRGKKYSGLVSDTVGGRDDDIYLVENVEEITSGHKTATVYARLKDGRVLKAEIEKNGEVKVKAGFDPELKKAIRRWDSVQAGWVAFMEKKGQFKDYEGGAGPDESQITKNDEALLAKLKAAGLPAAYHLDKSWAGQPADKIKTVIVRRARGRSTIHASYDRWGFVVDELHLDQVSLKEATDAIIAWYREK